MTKFYRMAILNDAPLSKSGYGWSASDPFHKFVGAVARLCHVNLVCPVKKSENTIKSGVFILPEDASINVYNSLPAVSISAFYARLPKLILINFRQYRAACRASDAVFLRMSTPNSFLLFIIAKLSRKPIIVFFPGNPLDVAMEGSKYLGFVREIALLVGNFHLFLWKKTAKKSSLVFASSRLIANLVMGQNGNARILRTSLISDEEIRVDIRPVISKLNLLYAGRLSHEKGLVDLLNAAKIIRNTGISFHLTICGTGPDLSILEKYVQSGNLESQVTFLGFLPPGKKLLNEFCKHHIFLSPSYSEGFPKVIFEAMAQGLAIITTPVGGIPEVIVDSQNGLFVPVKSPERIAEAVERLSRNEQLRRQLIINGYETIKENTIDIRARYLVETITQQCKV